MAQSLILGITKIGDLLLDNKITDIGDHKALDNIRLKIPEYQRPYKWSARNVNQLLDDIEDAMARNKEVYRVGTLILHHDVKEDTWNIVDGQQRTITFSLILKCLQDREIDFLKQKLSNNPYNVHNVQNNFRALQRRFGKHPEQWKSAGGISESADGTKQTGDNGTSERVADAERAKNLNDLERYIETQCELIVVITEDLSEAFQFFDSQNARGKALYPHDLLKAYHLREMENLNSEETEQIVRRWENLDQKDLAALFNGYLYRLKCWIHGNYAGELNEQNIDMFKGLTAKDRYPYAQYYKSAFAYADHLNHSSVPLVTGLQPMTPFQIDAPIIAGKPFFEYAEHYFSILKDIQDNDRYEGYLINDNEIIKTLDLRKYKNGVGNRVTRLMLDTAILLYADRFCPGHPSREDLDYLDEFVRYAFAWAYSMRAQYYNVGWLVAQNYIMGTSKKDGIINSFNLYKVIADADSPEALRNRLADLIMPIDRGNVRVRRREQIDACEQGVYQNYLHYFKHYGFGDFGDDQYVG